MQYHQGGRGYRTVNCTGNLSFITTLTYKLWLLLSYFDSLILNFNNKKIIYRISIIVCIINWAFITLSIYFKKLFLMLSFNIIARRFHGPLVSLWITKTVRTNLYFYFQLETKDSLDLESGVSVRTEESTDFSAVQSCTTAGSTASR